MTSPSTTRLAQTVEQTTGFKVVIVATSQDFVNWIPTQAVTSDWLRIIFSAAQFVIVLLSKEYPKRIWTKFESEQFKKKLKKGGVIPVWFSDAPPSLFDESSRVGGITYDVTGDVSAQVAAMCDTFAKRMTESRMVKPAAI